VPAVQTKAQKPKPVKSDAVALSEATRRLLKGIKAHAKTTGQPLTRQELIRRGYTKEFISQLEAA
jgi:hypothetical protein